MNLIIVGLIGLVFTGIGLAMRLGHMKSIYLTKGISIAMPEVVKYIFLPLGLVLIVVELLVSDLIPFEMRLAFFNGIVWPLLIFTFILAVWQPSWLLPRWLQYLRKTYGYEVTEILLSTEHKYPDWEKRVSTHEGLVTWADEAFDQLRHEWGMLDLTIEELLEMEDKK